MEGKNAVDQIVLEELIATRKESISEYSWMKASSDPTLVNST